MNGKDLLDKMSEVDPKLIEDADKAAEKQPKKKRALFIGLSSGMATVAAALAIIIGINAGSAKKVSVDSDPPVGVLVSVPEDGIKTAVDSGGELNAHGNSTIIMQAPAIMDIKPEEVVNEAFAEYGALPKVSNKDFGVHGAGFGWTKVGLYSVYAGGAPNSLEDFSPWSVDAELTTLPVYLSNSTTPDIEKMTKRVKSAAAILGIPEDELEIKNRGMNGVGDFGSYRKILEEQGLSEEEIEAEIDRISRVSGAQTSIEGTSSSVTINAHTDGSLWFYFKEPYPELPEDYNLDLHNPAPDVLAATVEYLAEKYKELFGYQNPKVARCEGNFEYEYLVYEAEGDLGAQIVNYRLKYGVFLPNWDNPREMDMLRVYTSDNLEKLGDYPIYTAQQALWVMSSDRVPEEVRIPKGAEVVKVELEYNNRIGYTAVIPYYVFTVKTDESSQSTEGQVYKYYHIPAVPEQFLDMDIEDYGVRA